MNTQEEMVQALRDAQAYLRWLQTTGQRLIAENAECGTRNAEYKSGGVDEVARSKSAGAGVVKEPGASADSMTMARTSTSTIVEVAVHEVPMPPSGSCGTQAECLERLSHIVQACRKCRLGYSRTQAVFGSGNLAADLMFIGEAPGANEDATGLPFVGQAGKVLTAELEKNGIKRDDVFICNIIKCRPPDNRDPMPDEIEACVPYLHEQIELIRPKMLCGLGRYACSVLMAEAIKIMKIRGTWSKYQGLPLFICLHPSAVLHQPNNRQLFNDDVAALAKAYHARKK
jgi:DNA polymerase